MYKNAGDIIAIQCKKPRILLGVRFVDSFCGIGAFTHVLESHGAERAFACDNEPRVRDIYLANHGTQPANDIKQIASEDIPPHQILCAGFPCPSYSTAGNRQGMSSRDGQLVFDALRIAEHHCPEVILLENVTGLLSSNRGKDFARIIARLEILGYNACWETLNAGDFGLSQFRQRVLIVGIRSDLGVNSFRFPAPYNTFSVIDDIVEHDIDVEEFRCKRNDILRTPSPPMVHHPCFVLNLPESTSRWMWATAMP